MSTLIPPPSARHEAASLMDQVKAKRIEKGMDQREVADIVRRSQSMISSWETHTCAPILTNFIELCRAVGLKIVLEEESCGSEQPVSA